MEINLNSVNAEQENVVDFQNSDLDSMSEIEDNPQSTSEDVANLPNLKNNSQKSQSREENAHFANMRRQKEEAILKMSQMQDEQNKILEILGDSGFKGTTVSEIIENYEAEKQGITIEEYNQQKED